MKLRCLDLFSGIGGMSLAPRKKRGEEGMTWLCWFFHKWPQWSEGRTCGSYTIQHRFCLRCNARSERVT